MQAVTPSSAGFKSRSQIAVVIILSIVAFSLLYLFRASEQTNNALFYAHVAATGERLFEPPAHLMYGAILHIFHTMIGSFASTNSIWAGQIHGLIWATVCIISIFMIVQRLMGSAMYGLIAAVFLLVLNGFWTYSTQTETYVPMLAPLALLTALVIGHNGNTLSCKERVAYAALLFASIMYHQMGVLFVIPLSYLVFSKWGWRGTKDLSIVLLLSGAATLSAYLLVFILTQPGAISKDFVHWVLHYRYEFDELGKISHFNLKSILSFLHSQINCLVVLPSQLGILQKAFSAFFLMLLAFSLAWNLIQVVRRAKHYHIRAFFLLWYLTYTIFCIWWNPSVYKFLYPNLVPIVVLSTFVVFDILNYQKYEGYTRRIVAPLLVVLFVFIAGFNFNFSFLPIHNSKGPYFKDAAKLQKIVDPKCNIYVNSNVAFNLMYYFASERAESLKKLFIGFHEDNIKNTNQFINEHCTLVPISAVTRSYYSKKSKQYNLSQTWTEFIKWLLGVKESAQSVTYHSYEIVNDHAGLHYILVDRTSRIEIDQLKSLFAQVAQDLDKASKSEQASGGSHAERDKKLIFGY